jgi:hypothetical protein
MSAQLKPSILELSSQYTPITEGCFNVATNIFALNLKDDILNDNEIRLLNQMYSTLYQHEFNVCSSVKVCKELYVNGTIIGSMTGRSTRQIERKNISCYIKASLSNWCILGG